MKMENRRRANVRGRQQCILRRSRRHYVTVVHVGEAAAFLMLFHSLREGTLNRNQYQGVIGWPMLGTNVGSCHGDRARGVAFV